MIRRANSADFQFIYELYMHPQINPFLLYEPMDAENFQPIFNALLQQALKYVYVDHSERIGMFKLVPLLHRSDHIVYLGGLAVHPYFAGRGEGSKMLKEIIAFAKTRGYLRIELSAAVVNEKAIRLYEKSGFQKEGVLRKYTHLKSEQKFLDEIVMSYLF